ncbi:Hypothetical protein ORPV_523 [Orpheovirus IHUMI-LCC2]|uniref:Uncharacterized protein n=1 Tax=Orpheovirus IHUMI-LCC2 TaxID=2023057 RepID=A0A2I2L4H3_9VIRU|nr:Hypothetical protein ORPV_523 [Orpheovirus IHUMI-LCC2]SNW62427.1 Hypothetical protein ORPV_523 [Orpheovirus IHUMI-LCC2]
MYPKKSYITKDEADITRLLNLPKEYLNKALSNYDVNRLITLCGKDKRLISLCDGMWKDKVLNDFGLQLYKTRDAEDKFNLVKYLYSDGADAVVKIIINTNTNNKLNQSELLRLSLRACGNAVHKLPEGLISVPERNVESIKYDGDDSYFGEVGGIMIECWDGKFYMEEMDDTGSYNCYLVPNVNKKLRMGDLEKIQGTFNSGKVIVLYKFSKLGKFAYNPINNVEILDMADTEDQQEYSDDEDLPPQYTLFYNFTDKSKLNISFS